MRNKFIFLLPIVFLSLALTSCTSELGTFLEAINKGLGRTEEVKKEIMAPVGYYEKDQISNMPNTYKNLKKFLKSRVLPSGYETHKFDCSEMSAFLEWRLEDAGFDAYIAEGPAPWDPQKYHAWVLVRAWRDTKLEWFAVEAADPSFYNLDEGVTGKKIIKRIFSFKIPGFVWSKPYWRKYYTSYKYLYNSINDIPKSKLSEYDWWNVFALAT